MENNITPAQKCIEKWSKKLTRLKKQRDLHGEQWYDTYKVRIDIIIEILKDLKRLTQQP